MKSHDHSVPAIIIMLLYLPHLAFSLLRYNGELAEDGNS